MEGWTTETGLSYDDFEKFTRYIHSNNAIDNKNRARILGLPEGVKVAPGAIVRLGDEGRVGNNVFIGLFSYVNGDVVLEDDVLIGPHCCLTSNTHLFNPSTESFRGKNINKPIVVGRGSWLAAGAMVTAGAKVGRCNLICANAVVTKDTPDFAICAGTPARPIGSVDPTTGELKWMKNEDSDQNNFLGPAQLPVFPETD